MAHPINGNEIHYNMQDVFALTRTLTSKLGQNRFLSDNGHVEYHIKENGTYNNMQEIFVSLHVYHRPLGWGQKVETYIFLKVVMLHIKLNGMNHTISCKQIFCPYQHTRPLGGV